MIMKSPIYIIKKMAYLLTHEPHIIMLMLSSRGLFNWMSDEQYLRILYRLAMRERLDLENPNNYNAKLQWLKLNDRKDIYSVMVDKYDAKQYIASVVGEEYLIPTLGVWNNFEEIDFASLPNRFVLKCTHDSGGVSICRDKENYDIDRARKKIQKSLRRNYYYLYREWPYKSLKPRIIAEEYMEEGDGEGEENVLTDYKFFCFDGVPKIMYISKDKAQQPYTDFYDMDFNHLPIHVKDPNSDVKREKPKEFDLMKRLAEALSKGMPHLRVDFYVIKEKIYVGELTFYHNGGVTRIQPDEWNIKMGEWIQIKK